MKITMSKSLGLNYTKDYVDYDVTLHFLHIGPVQFRWITE